MYPSADTTRRGAGPAFTPRGTASNSAPVPRRANFRSFALSRDFDRCCAMTTQPPRHSRLRRRVPCCPNRRVVRPVQSRSSSLRSRSRAGRRRGTCYQRWFRHSRLLDERHRRVLRGVERRESRRRMDRRAVSAGEPRTRTRTILLRWQRRWRPERRRTARLRRTQQTSCRGFLVCGSRVKVWRRRRRVVVERRRGPRTPLSLLG